MTIVPAADSISDKNYTYPLILQASYCSGFTAFQGLPFGVLGKISTPLECIFPKNLVPPYHCKLNCLKNKRIPVNGIYGIKLKQKLW